jgi:hypothetical protein
MRTTKLSAAIAAAATFLVVAPAGALARPHVHAGPAGCRAIAFAEPHVITTGESAELFGALVCAGGPTAGAGQTVTVNEHAAGTPGIKLFGTTTTGAGGAFSLPAPGITTDTVFYIKVGASSRMIKRTVRVAPLVTLEAKGLPEGANVLTGPNHKVLFSGKVTPADAGAEVVLEREAAIGNEEWHPIQRGSVGGEGGFSILHRFLIPGDANLRVVVRPHGAFDVRGISNTLSLEVSQAQNPRLTIFSSADPVPFGTPITISGVLAGGAGQKVTLFARAIATKGFVKGEETVAGPGGAYKFVIPAAAANEVYRVSSATRNSAAMYQGVKYILTAGAAPTTVQQGQSVTFSGTVTPGPVGKVVYLERENFAGGGFHVVDLGNVTAGGKYTITHPMFQLGKGVFRIKVPGDPSNQAAASGPFPIEVTPAPPGALKPGHQGTLPH